MSKPPTRLMLKPAQLRLIQQIAEHGQLQLAAETVGMTQPAASRMLAEAEALVGAPMFLRLPKGMEPTEIGRAVLRRANAILCEMLSMGADVAALRSADTRLRDALGGRGPATLDVRIASPKGNDPLVIAQEKGADTYAVMVGPIAARLKEITEEEGSFYKIIQSVLVAHLHGNAAQISVEIGRGSVPSGAQPSFLELEEALSAIPAEA